jgi:hypothetical protein
MAYSSLILKSFALKTFVSLGNCYPDHLFRYARRLLHRIALDNASRGGDRR